jgi:pentatricopeptide repeat protein
MRAAHSADADRSCMHAPSSVLYVKPSGCMPCMHDMHPDVCTYNTLVKACASSRRVADAFGLLHDMRTAHSADGDSGWGIAHLQQLGQRSGDGCGGRVALIELFDLIAPIQ